MATLSGVGHGAITNLPGNAKSIGQPFQHRVGTNWQNNSFSGSWTTIMETGYINLPAKSIFTNHYRGPYRNDANSWGGAYLRFYYELQSGGCWIYCGHSCYSTAMCMSKYMISGYNHILHYDFTNQSSDYNIRFRVQGTHHDGTTYAGNDHGLSDGQDTHTGYTGNWRHWMTINGFSYNY